MKSKADEKFRKSFGSQGRVLFIKSLPCLVCGRIPSVNAHIKSRGSGGDYRSIVPLCRIHHTEQGQIGIVTFANKYNIDLEVEAAKINELTDWLLTNE